MWKPLLSYGSDHSNPMETRLYGNYSVIKVATTAQLFGNDRKSWSALQQNADKETPAFNISVGSFRFETL